LEEGEGEAKDGHHEDDGDEGGELKLAADSHAGRGGCEGFMTDWRAGDKRGGGEREAGGRG
jgi:hypothetical protein